MLDPTGQVMRVPRLAVTSGGTVRALDSYRGLTMKRGSLRIGSNLNFILATSKLVKLVLDKVPEVVYNIYLFNSVIQKGAQ